MARLRDMQLTADDIIEAIIDELAIGELGESVDSFVLERVGPGDLSLDPPMSRGW